MSNRRPIQIVLLVAVLFAGYGTEAARAESQIIDSPRAPEDVQQAVSDVLADPEFRHLREKDDAASEDGFNRDDLPQWLRNFLDWLVRDESEPDEPSNTFSLAGVLYYVALAALAVALIVLLVAIVRSADQRTASDSMNFSADEEAIVPTQPPGDIPANEYERRALAAAQLGDFRGALRELVLGSMSWTERAGLIRYRRGLTNRDYVRAVWRMIERRESLLQIVAAFERVFYGRRMADGATFESCLVEFRKSFRTEANDAQPSN